MLRKPMLSIFSTIYFGLSFLSDTLILLLFEFLTVWKIGLKLYFHIPDHHPYAAAKSLQSCPTLCNPIDGNLPVSSVHGIFQARVLEWGAIAFSDHPYATIIYSHVKNFLFLIFLI